MFVRKTGSVFTGMTLRGTLGSALGETDFSRLLAIDNFLKGIRSGGAGINTLISKASKRGLGSIINATRESGE